MEKIPITETQKKYGVDFCGELSLHEKINLRGRKSELYSCQCGIIFWAEEPICPGCCWPTEPYTDEAGQK